MAAGYARSVAKWALASGADRRRDSTYRVAPGTRDLLV
jgi:hypothetical protein